MITRARPSATQRFAVLGGVIALHALALLLILALHSPGQQAVKPMALQLMTFSTDQPAASQPPKPVMPSKVPARPIPEAELAKAIENASAPAGMIGNCETLSRISQALLADPAAVAAVHAVPQEMRSVADAIVVWNAGWSPAANADDAPLGTVRMLVVENLAGVPDSCLDEAIAGPRLIPVTDGERTTFLAFGSGNWSWRQILDSPDALSPLSLPGPAPVQTDAQTAHESNRSFVLGT